MEAVESKLAYPSILALSTVNANAYDLEFFIQYFKYLSFILVKTSSKIEIFYAFEYSAISKK
jgi:hypothetical protein